MHPIGFPHEPMAKSQVAPQNGGHKHWGAPVRVRRPHLTSSKIHTNQSNVHTRQQGGSKHGHKSHTFS
jgi:hypothetical protein